VHEGLVAESLVYSTLQSGPEFAAWLAARPAPKQRAKPDHPAVRIERVEGRLELWLDRAEKRNAFSAEMRDALCEALAIAVIDASVERVSLRGEGPVFCSGGDLDEFGTLPDPATAHAIRSTRHPARLLHALARRVECVVQGTCVGAGVELPAFAARVVARPGRLVPIARARHGARAWVGRHGQPAAPDRPPAPRPGSRSRPSRSTSRRALAVAPRGRDRGRSKQQPSQVPPPLTRPKTRSGDAGGERWRACMAVGGRSVRNRAQCATSPPAPAPGTAALAGHGAARAARRACPAMRAVAGRPTAIAALRERAGSSTTRSGDARAWSISNSAHAARADRSRLAIEELGRRSRRLAPLDFVPPVARGRRRWWAIANRTRVGRGDLDPVRSRLASSGSASGAPSLSRASRASGAAHRDLPAGADEPARVGVAPGTLDAPGRAQARYVLDGSRTGVP
jgi:hypothetical protein